MKILFAYAINEQIFVTHTLAKNEKFDNIEFHFAAHHSA